MEQGLKFSEINIKESGFSFFFFPEHKLKLDKNHNEKFSKRKNFNKSKILWLITLMSTIQRNEKEEKKKITFS